MPAHKDKLRNHKLLFELKFLYADLEYHRVAVDEAGRDFQKELIKKYEGDKDLGVAPQSEPHSEESAVQEPTPEDASDIYQIDKKDIDKEVKDLYKKIVTITHPDKLTSLSKSERDHKRGLFLKASEAAGENRLFALQQIALDLGIDIGDLSDDQVRILKLESKKIKKEIDKMTNSYAWVWYNEDSEEIKDELITRYGEIIKSLSKEAESENSEKEE